MPIHLPAAIIPQVKVLFRIVVYMTRGSIAHQRLKQLLRLQVSNGVRYNLQYTSKSIPGIVRFLDKVVAGFKRKLWAVMMEEVKVRSSQWLATMVSAHLLVPTFKNFAVRDKMLLRRCAAHHCELASHPAFTTSITS